jgi:hypothetical protein
MRGFESAGTLWGWDRMQRVDLLVLVEAGPPRVAIFGWFVLEEFSMIQESFDERSKVW